MLLYASLLLGSIIVPLIFSFDKNLRYYRRWKSTLISLSVIAAVFIAKDIAFTRFGIWGFNPAYHSGIIILDLPLEEWLFFFFIPYACMFIHESGSFMYPKLRAGKSLTRALTMLIAAGSLAAMWLYHDKAYTVVDAGLVVLALALSSFDKAQTLQKFYVTFPVMLVPFFIVNSILTGSVTAAPVVWYNSAEFSGIRLGTVPIEDFGYAFSLVLFNLLLSSYLQNKFTHRQLKRSDAVLP